MLDYGIKIGHGVHSSSFMASKTILCQAVLAANGGLKDAHFMRYAAFQLIYALRIWFLCPSCHIEVKGVTPFQMIFGTFIVPSIKQLYHIWLLIPPENENNKNTLRRSFAVADTS